MDKAKFKDYLDYHLKHLSLFEMLFHLIVFNHIEFMDYFFELYPDFDLSQDDYPWFARAMMCDSTVALEKILKQFEAQKINLELTEEQKYQIKKNKIRPILKESLDSVLNVSKEMETFVKNYINFDSEEFNSRNDEEMFQEFDDIPLKPFPPIEINQDSSNDS